MTQGSPSKILLSFTLPMLLSVVFQQLYSIVDSVVAGRYIGMNALAAVGLSTPITIIFLAFATGSSTGCSVVVSQLFGAKEISEMKTAISTAIISIVALSAVITGIGLLICNPLIRLINTPAEIFDDSALYLRIYVYGLLFLFLYNAATAILTGLGDSRTPLYFLIFSSVLNIVLDLVFVIVLKMGVAGVGWATFIAQGLASVFAIIYLLIRMKRIKADQPHKIFDLSMLFRMYRIAIPSILQQSFVSVGQLCVQNLINGFGSAVIAGFSAAFKINTFTVTSISTIANALSSYTAQNIGARKPERVKVGYRAAVWMVAVFYVIISVILFGFGKQILSLFMDDSATREVLTVGLHFTWVVTPFYIMVALKVVTDSVMRGAGAMKQFMITTFFDLVLRVILAYLLSGWLGYSAVYWAIGIGWTLSMLLSLWFYHRGTWLSKEII